MTNSEKLKELLWSFYTKKASYQDLKTNHLKVIDLYHHKWIDASRVKPVNGTRVFAVQDLTFLGKGRFVGEYYYFEKYGFVANETDDDGYGYITRWISFDTVDML